MIHTSSPKVVIVAFKMHGNCDRVVHGKAFAVYRDATGKIIGSSDEDIYNAMYYGPGDSDGSMLVRQWYPSETDEARTEVYVMQGV